MFEGQYLHYSKEDGASNVILSPWMPRQADNATFTIETLQDGGAGLEVGILTKNSEDAGDGGTPVGSAITAGASGTVDETYTGLLKEMVRYQFTISGSAGGEFILFRMLSPIWRNSA